MASANTPFCGGARKWFFVGLAFLTCAGCSSWNLPKDILWPWDEKPPKPPARFTDMWTFTILRQSGLPGIRGFGGRVTFFDGNDKPMKVNGTFTVYAFNAHSENPSAALPERKFVFLAKDLPKHHDKTKLGDSYSVWLPWDEVGGEERQLTLIARLEAENGEVVMGSASRQILSGEKPATKKELLPKGTAKLESKLEARMEAKTKAATESSEADSVRAASYQEPVSGRTASDKMCVQTIDVPPGFASRSLRSPDSPPSAKSDAATAASSAATSAAAPSNTSATTAGVVKDAASAAGAKSAKANSDATEEVESSTRFGPPRLQARRESIVGPTSDPFRKAQRRGQWPSSPPIAPRSVPWHETPDSPADAPTKATTTSPPTDQSAQN